MNSSLSLTKEIDFYLHFRRVGIFTCAENSFPLSQAACSLCSGGAVRSQKKKKSYKPFNILSSVNHRTMCLLVGKDK